MTRRSQKVGDAVDAYCRRCKQVGNATIAAVVDDSIMTVVCGECRERQRYKESKPKNRGRVRVVDVEAAKPGRRARQDTPMRPMVSTLEETPRDRQHGQRKKPLTDKCDDPQATRWRRATDGVHSRFARPHRVGDRYVTDELILHKVHGMGVIEKVGRDGTLGVLFRTGIVLLPSGSMEASGR